MKTSSLRFILATACTLVACAIAFAGDPTGTWNWTMTGRNGDTMKASLKLELKDGVLTGTAHGMRGDTPITAATFKDDAIAFTVVREYNDNKFEIKYSGKLSGDTITGSIVSPSRDGGTRTVAWNATRAGAASPPAAPGS